MTELVVRPLVAGEEHLFDDFTDKGLVGFAAFGRSYQEFAELGQYRPEWTWIARRGDRIVARAAWWGGPEDTEPMSLDWFDFGDDTEAADALLRAAPYRTEYVLALPPQWRTKPEVHAEATARIDAVQRAGMKPMVERVRFTWTPADGLPERPGRLDYRAEPDDEAIVPVLARIQQGSLDAHHADDIARLGVEAAAYEELAVLRWFPSPREWWRLAYTPEGELVGITTPGRNYASPVVGYIGVVPEQRGHGYAYDLLVECMHMLVAEGVTEIVGETDGPNKPMAAAFTRANFPITQERVFLKY